MLDQGELAVRFYLVLLLVVAGPSDWSIGVDGTTAA